MAWLSSTELVLSRALPVADDYHMSDTQIQSLVPILLVGGPTVVMDYAGFRIITDPTFDEPKIYGPDKTHSANTLIKTHDSALKPADIGEIDIVLASHHHLDNFDESGREFSKNAPHLFGTAEVAKIAPNATVLEKWDTRKLTSSTGKEVTITAVPAQHGPDGLWQKLGTVIGFVLTCEGEKTIYISGDNSSVDVVREVADSFPNIDVAFLFAGGPCFELYGGDYITFSDETAVEAGKILSGAILVPVHADSWEHLTQTAVSMKELAEEHGIGDRVIALLPGESAEI